MRNAKERTNGLKDGVRKGQRKRKRPGWKLDQAGWTKSQNALEFSPHVGGAHPQSRTCPLDWPDSFVLALFSCKCIVIAVCCRSVRSLKSFCHIRPTHKNNTCRYGHKVRQPNLYQSPHLTHGSTMIKNVTESIQGPRHIQGQNHHENSNERRGSKWYVIQMIKL